VKSRRKEGGLDPRTVNNPYISGFAYQINWVDIEPVQGKPDWSKLDALFAAAESARKWVRLVVIPGYFAPPWAVDGAKSETFSVQYGLYQGQDLNLPMPWDGVYLAHWFAFLKELSGRYQRSPAFRLIAAAGPTSVSDELTMPHAPAELKIWQRNSYTPRRFLEAWQRVFQTYAAYFPNQYVTLTVGQGLPLNDQGRVDHAEPARTREAVSEQARSILGHRFVLMNQDLHAGPKEHEETDLVRNYAGRAITALQMRCGSQDQVGSKAMGAEGDPPLALRRSIALGMQPSSAGQHVSFLEIQEPDILAAPMQPVLRDAAALFERKQ